MCVAVSVLCQDIIKPIKILKGVGLMSKVGHNKFLQLQVSMSIHVLLMY